MNLHYTVESLLNKVHLLRVIDQGFNIFFEVVSGENILKTGSMPTVRCRMSRIPLLESRHGLDTPNYFERNGCSWLPKKYSEWCCTSSSPLWFAKVENWNLVLCNLCRVKILSQRKIILVQYYVIIRSCFCKTARRSCWRHCYSRLKEEALVLYWCCFGCCAWLYKKLGVLNLSTPSFLVF